MRRLLLSALLCACSISPSVEVWHGDVTFTPTEREEIERGYKFLARRVGAKRLDIVWDAPHDELAPCPFATICRREEINGGRFIGQYTDNAIAIVPTANIAAVAAHEFGHWKGLDHHPGPGLMNPAAPAIPMWTVDDDESMDAR